MDRTIIVTPYKDSLFILVPTCFTTGTLSWRHHLIWWNRCCSSLPSVDAAVLLNCMMVPCMLRVSGHRMIHWRRNACPLADLTTLPMCDWNYSRHQLLLFLKVCVGPLAVALWVKGYNLVSGIAYSVSSLDLRRENTILLSILKVILSLTQDRCFLNLAEDFAIVA